MEQQRSCIPASVFAANFAHGDSGENYREILIGGLFASVMGGVTRNSIARLNTDGTLDTAFDPNANSSVFTIAVQADGKIFAGGNFSSTGSQPRNLFARLANDTVALQNLAVTQTTITWTRGGSSPNSRASPSSPRAIT